MSPFDATQPKTMQNDAKTMRNDAIIRHFLGAPSFLGAGVWQPYISESKVN